MFKKQKISRKNTCACITDIPEGCNDRAIAIFQFISFLLDCNTSDFQSVSYKSIDREIKILLDILTQKEKTIISKIYGLDSTKFTFKEIADDKSFNGPHTPEMVQNILEKAIIKLQANNRLEPIKKLLGI